MDRFESLSPPDPSAEEWRYAELALDLAAFSLLEEPGPSLGEHRLAPAGGGSGRASVVDGFVTSTEGLAKRLTDTDTAAEASPPDDWYSAASTAFGSDAVVVDIGAGETVEGPVFVDLQAVTPGAITLPRLAISVGEASSVSIVVTQRSSDDLEALVVPHIDIEVGAASRVGVTVVQEWGARTVAVGRPRLTVGQDATAVFAEAGLGGSYSRLRLDADLEGRGASVTVLGAYFGEGDQTLDYRYFMRHSAPNTTSEMFLKGAVADESRSVFSGLIRIEPEGQGTNAHQTNRNLVLGAAAEAHSVPNLEILADDVRCGHGSAVGPLDDEQRYYLMSRGLDRRRADRLQVKGFFEEALRRFAHTEFGPELRDAVMAKYARVEGAA